MFPGYWLASKDILMHHFLLDFLQHIIVTVLVPIFLDFFFHPEFCFVT
jgi:hypothetical protein